MNALATGVFVERVRIDCGGQRLTTNFGQPIADNQNSFTHFDHERIPERSAGRRGVHSRHGKHRNRDRATDPPGVRPLARICIPRPLRRG
jgi:catalase